MQAIEGDDVRFARMLGHFKIDDLSKLPASEYEPLMARLNGKKEQVREAQ
jgi:hypothetical protein